jgi:hypothetical protein
MAISGEQADFPQEIRVLVKRSKRKKREVPSGSSIFLALAKEMLPSVRNHPSLAHASPGAVPLPQIHPHQMPPKKIGKFEKRKGL